METHAFERAGIAAIDWLWGVSFSLLLFDDAFAKRFAAPDSLSRCSARPESGEFSS